MKMTKASSQVLSSRKSNFVCAADRVFRRMCQTERGDWPGEVLEEDGAEYREERSMLAPRYQGSLRLGYGSSWAAKA